MVSVELSNPDIALVLVTAVWLFVINSVACCVETVRGRGHRHKLS